jgi:CheY-like chemotaxis protein
VLEAGDALRTLVNEILDFSTMETGAIKLDPVSFSLREMLENCLSIVRPAATVKGLELELRLDGELPPLVIGDSWRVRQILLNLLHNGIKFTQRGSVELSIRCAAATDRVDVRFAVHDTGIGISEGDRAKLFERFSQADASATRRFGGTGLGLTISQRLVTSMGGAIGVDSAPGVGSTFWFSLVLPLAPVQHPDEHAAATSADGVAPLDILVVDDHEMNRDLAATILRQAGHSADVAADGAVAVHMARTKRYDLILMDIQMPELDGLEATRQIREQGREAGRLPIIAMTANVLPEHLARYLEAGMTDSIGKPLDAKRLLAGVARWSRREPPVSAEPAVESSSPACAPTVHDRAAWDNLVKLFGAERVQRFARNLQETLEAGPWVGSARADREALIKPAHSCVSQAGQLGFAELSGASRTLETECRRDGAVDAALCAFGAARLRALGELERLLAAMREPRNVQAQVEAEEPIA